MRRTPDVVPALREIDCGFFRATAQGLPARRGSRRGGESGRAGQNRAGWRLRGAATGDRPCHRDGRCRVPFPFACLGRRLQAAALNATIFLLKNVIRQ